MSIHTENKVIIHYFFSRLEKYKHKNKNAMLKLVSLEISSEIAKRFFFFLRKLCKSMRTDKFIHGRVSINGNGGVNRAWEGLVCIFDTLTASTRAVIS